MARRAAISESAPYETHRINAKLLRDEKEKYLKTQSGNPEKGAVKKGSKQTYPFSIRVKFRSRRDADEFAQLMGRNLPYEQRDILYKPTRRSKIARFTGDPPRSRMSDPSTAWRSHWVHMPEFLQQKSKWEHHRIRVTISDEADHIAFANVVRQKLTRKTVSIYYPQWTPSVLKDKAWVSRLPKAQRQPRYPIFIISKGRAFSRLTSKSLEALGVPYFIVIEPAEYDAYAAVISPKKILVLPFDSDPKNPTGPGRARNWCWDYAKNVLGAKRHWVMDDNIDGFYRLHKNRRYKVGDGTMFRACEDFVDRYENIRIAGLQYRFFCSPKDAYPPYVTNTRIYSCLLIDNDCKRRWRGRYNEDTILSLDVLNDGDCTVQFNAFLQGKMATQVLDGGNTEVFYHNEELEDYAQSLGRYHDLGTLKKSVYLKQIYPQYTTVVERYGRVHHFVDYSSFRGNKLRLKKRRVQGRSDDYGLELTTVC